MTETRLVPDLIPSCNNGFGSVSFLTDSGQVDCVRHSKKGQRSGFHFFSHFGGGRQFLVRLVTVSDPLRPYMFLSHSKFQGRS